MPDVDKGIFRFGNCRLDVQKKLLWFGGEPVQLPLKSMELLCLLAERAGDVVSKEEIWGSVWQDSFVEETNLTHNIYLLRKTFRELGEGDLIQTLPRRGYRFRGEMKRAETGPNDLIVERHVIAKTSIEEVSESEYGSSTINRPKLSIVRRHYGAAAAVGILLVMGAAVAVYRSRPKQQKLSPAEVHSIAVMPFVNGGSNENREFLADGMTESLISSLSQVREITVKAPDSVFRYKGKEISVRDVGQQLNVQALLEGHLSQENGRLAVYVTLVDTQSETVIWGKQYERAENELFLLQSEIARDLYAGLRTNVPAGTLENLAQISTQDPEAYELYLRGRYHWNKRNPADLQRSIDYFQQAIDLDPNYAFAYAGLANAIPYLASYGNISPLVLMPKARDAALKAIEIDGDLAEAHTALGLILHGFDHDRVGAEREFRLAIEKNPNYAHAHQLYGELLDCESRHDEAESEFRLALEMDPLSLIVNRMYGEHLFYSGKYDESIVQLKRTIDLDPRFYTAHASLAYVYQFRGQYSDAVEEYAMTHEALGELDNAKKIRESYSAQGWTGFLRFMTSEDRPKSLPMYNVAVFAAELGDRKRALAILNDLCEDRNYLVNWINVDPRLGPLRNEPGFAELIDKLNLKS